jgi:hypothetical protein
MGRADSGKQYYYLRMEQGSDMNITQAWRMPSNITCPDGCMFQ